jgi:hypothetical protein
VREPQIADLRRGRGFERISITVTQIQMQHRCAHQVVAQRTPSIVIRPVAQCR